MTTTASIAELQRAGVILDAGEAVAVTQQLIQTLRDGHEDHGTEPPYGPPTASNVILNADGTVTCGACGTTPAISEIAIFLDALLPAGSVRVPGGLRYIIARGLLEVDAAPFDSLDDFSLALARHERGPRGDVLRSLLLRAETLCAVAHADRRRAGTTELRRALREADAQLYAHQRAGMPIVPAPRRQGTMPAVAACVGAGIMLIAAGEFMYGRRIPGPVAAPAVVPRMVAVSTPGPSAVTAMTMPGPVIERATPPRSIELPKAGRALHRRPAAPARAAAATPPVRPTPLSPGQFGRSDWRSARPAERASETGVRKVGSPRTSHGILEHLKFRWLRNAFSAQS